MRRLLLFMIILITTTIVSFGLTITLLDGCSFDRYVKVEAGEYFPVETGSFHDSPAVSLISSLQIDREDNTMELGLVNGSIISSALSARSKQDWPSGCPANLGSTRMEVVDLEINELTIGDVVIRNPILVRNCPDDPQRLILREDGQIGGDGTACSQDDTCIHFKPANLANRLDLN